MTLIIKPTCFSSKITPIFRECRRIASYFTVIPIDIVCNERGYMTSEADEMIATGYCPPNRFDNIEHAQPHVVPVNVRMVSSDTKEGKDDDKGRYAKVSPVKVVSTEPVFEEQKVSPPPGPAQQEFPPASASVHGAEGSGKKKHSFFRIIGHYDSSGEFVADSSSQASTVSEQLQDGTLEL